VLFDNLNGSHFLFHLAFDDFLKTTKAHPPARGSWQQGLRALFFREGIGVPVQPHRISIIRYERDFSERLLLLGRWQ
jgi:hypothetical protein